MEKDQAQQPTQTLDAPLPVVRAEQQPFETTIENGVEKPQDTVLAVAPSDQEHPKVEEAAGEDIPMDNFMSAAAAPPAAKPTENVNPDAIEEVNTAPGATLNSVEPVPQEPVDTRPPYLISNPALSQLFDRLTSVIELTGHNEMWGVTLKDSNDPPTVNILMKFLRANEGNAKLAEDQLVKALEWRKKTNPLALLEASVFPASKFKGLGYITIYDDASTGKNVVFTWNIYGSVKNVEGTFGNLEEFINWRVALMELAIRELRLGEATSVMDYNGEDPYQMIQVHDYQNVSFLRMNPVIRAASRQTIEVFSTAYPELLKEKYFINVPIVMGWVFTALKVFLSKNTIRKFHPITNGANLAREFKTFGGETPKCYGGKGEPLADTGRTVTLQDDVVNGPAAQPEVENDNAARAPDAEPASNTAVLADATDEPAKENPPQNEVVAPIASVHARQI